MKKHLAGLLCFFITVVGITSCKKEKSCAGCLENNRAPFANGGRDQVIILPASTANLDGSSSSDPDNNIISYTWTKISGPSSCTITNTNSAKTQVINLVQGVYQFELKAIDAKELFDKDTMIVTVSFQSLSCIIPVATQVGTFAESRVDMASVACNDKFYYSDGSIVDVFDPTSNLVISTTNLSTSRAHLSAISAGDKVFFAGGYIYPTAAYNQGVTVSRVDIYNTTSGIWSTAELSIARFGISTAVIGNKVLFAGGVTNSGPGAQLTTSRVDIYDLSTNTWGHRELSQPGRFVSAVVEDKVWFVTHGSNQIDIYDAFNDSWSTTLLSSPIYSSLPAVIYNNAAITLNQKIYFTGCQTVRVYDIPSHSWSTISLNENKFFIPVGISNNKIAFIGGMTSWFVYSTTIEVYDPTTNSWSTLYMSSDFYYESIISYNNFIYSAGGLINQENTALSGICRFQL